MKTELKKMGRRLIMKDKEPQAVIERKTEELSEYKKKVEDVDREREVISTSQSQKTALVHKNDELMAKLKTAQTQILETDCCNLKVNFIESLGGGSRRISSALKESRSWSVW
ncbi:unnamed protein product [Pleuronectes platessa]|uniref:Uncharacterized protein n=1 Tax=Pleuronectes platessa TaxID=8262 RepID=A0A9N7Z397_PLEPL|nr:unnamed protein product [Pleuronectes platessa]